tara:strand:- start:194 stop:2014 length:1821 start_codon:yes stop_codon:yes gene_type:complete
MIKKSEKNNEVTISNGKISFNLNYGKGLKIKNIFHLKTDTNWLEQNCDFFILNVKGVAYPSSSFKVQNIIIKENQSTQCVSFDLLSPSKIKINSRVSLYTEAHESIKMLIQMSASWPENCPEEVFMHLPFFRYFGDKNNKWHLSSNPLSREDGESVIKTHDAFDLPICNISKDNKTGFSLEFRDINKFAHSWNQLRNCDFLHMQKSDQLIDNNVLLRLQNNDYADVFETRFFSLNDGWSEAFSSWRDRIRLKLDLTEYSREDLKWYRNVVFQHFTFAYSKEIYNYDTNNFEIEKLIHDGKEFGGYDSILLWYQYPRLGVDERNQWDFNNDIPEGMEGVKKIAKIAHSKGVKLFLPFKPWDLRDDESSKTVVENIINLIIETDIDGIWFDTMDSVPNGLRERLDEKRKGIVFCTEIHPSSIENIEKITGHWDQFRFFEMPSSNILRYLIPENNAPITSRWQIGEGKDKLISRAIFNGTGIAIWQDIFGSWLPFSSNQKIRLKKWKYILLNNFDTFFGSKPIPCYPSLHEKCYINKFANDNGKEFIFSIYNSSVNNIEGSLFQFDGKDFQAKELWNNENLIIKDSVVYGKINSNDVKIIYICDQSDRI